MNRYETYLRTYASVAQAVHLRDRDAVPLNLAEGVQNNSPLSKLHRGVVEKVIEQNLHVLLVPPGGKELEAAYIVKFQAFAFIDRPGDSSGPV